MAEDGLDIRINVEGGEEGAAETTNLAAAINNLASKVDGLKTSSTSAEREVKKLADAEKRAEDHARGMAAATQASVQQSIQFTQRIAGAAAAVQSLSAAFGTTGSAAGLIARVAQSTAAMTQLGASFGPQGAVVGGIVGFFLPAIEGIIGAQARAEAATRSHREEIARLGVAAEEAADHIRDYNSASSRIGRAQGEVGREAAGAQLERALAGTFRDGSEAETAIPLLEERRRELERNRGTRSSGVSGASFLAGQAAGGVRGQAVSPFDAQIENLDAAIASAREAAEGFREIEDRVRLGGGTTTTRGGGGASESDGEQARLMANHAAEMRAAEEANAAEQRRLVAIQDEIVARTALGELQRTQAAERKAEIGEGIERAEALYQAEVARAEALSEMLKQKAQDTQEAHEAQVQSYQAVTGVIVGGLTDALSAIIAGQKSAEEAFLSLLASFLQFISEQAAIKAAFEFAEAIASIPAAPLVASHLAAGIAFTGVAVAAGAGSAVAGAAAGDVAAKSAAAKEKPASPESRSSGGGGGSQTVVNFNSPVLAYGSVDDLGRRVGQMVAASERRVGGTGIALAR